MSLAIKVSPQRLGLYKTSALKITGHIATITYEDNRIKRIDIPLDYRESNEYLWNVIERFDNPIKLFANYSIDQYVYGDTEIGSRVLSSVPTHKHHIVYGVVNDSSLYPIVIAPNQDAISALDERYSKLVDELKDAWFNGDKDWYFYGDLFESPLMIFIGDK